MARNSDFVGAGDLREPVRVLELTDTERGWEWTEKRRAWASVEAGATRNLFSSVGIGARSWSLVLRRQSLTLHNAIRWGTRHLFLTAITPRGRGHLDVEAAQVAVRSCGYQWPEGERSFPGVLTEKYIRHETENPMSLNAVCYVLVTPKAVELRPGRLVEVDGTPYHILTAHTLDDYKNEYEILRREDL